MIFCSSVCKCLFAACDRSGYFVNEASDSPMRSFKFDGGVDMVDKTARINNLENFFGIFASCGDQHSWG